MKYRFRLIRPLVWVSLLLTLTLAACASNALRDAESLARQGHHEEALARLQQSIDAHEDDQAIRTAWLKQRDTTVAHLIYLADAARAAGNLKEVESILVRMEKAAPDHPRTVWLRTEVDRIKRHQRLLKEAQADLGEKAYAKAESALRIVLSEDPGNDLARSLMGQVDEVREAQVRQRSILQLASGDQPVTLEFREAPIRTVFEALARAANVNFVFDKDVRGEAKVTLYLRQTTVNEALRVILNTQNLGYKLLNANTVLVFPNTQQKQRDLLDTVTRTFYLTNADPKQVQSLIRTVAKTRDIFVDERLNMLVVRDTPEVMRLIEKLVQNMDLPDPEVMLDVQVMEVSTNKLNQLGLSWPTEVNYGLPASSTASIVDSRSGLRWSALNPLAVATLKGSTDSTNLLANPKIRARNREKAKVLLGEKLPVFTTTSTANVGVSASVSYLDVGLKLDIEPRVQLDNDVNIKIDLEVSSITGKVTGPAGSLAYQVGTRQASTSLRLKDGETQILAGLINDQESRNSAGIPGLHDLPLAGRLFGTTTDSHNKTEVVLLITPHIVRNLIQPAAAGSAMPSGTEAQPGAAAWFMQNGEASSSPGNGAGASAARRPALGSGVPGAALRGNGVRVTGPDEVLPGSSFIVSVYNPGGMPLSTGLTYDSALFDAPDVQGANGRIQVEVPPHGNKNVTLQVKPKAGGAETDLALDEAGATWRIRVRDPQATTSDAPPPAEPPAQPDEPRSNSGATGDDPQP
ncbi:MAG: secretin and TonB N-terminal domain-containing protein [Burkholderiales bacterium]|nr:secretin and TonB N-terminal domain-containing protein [Burkholderiales bacterium]MDE2433910.1 secretin and TonB N-terminal domain-containing protein [Burkholderiales bacterium]